MKKIITICLCSIIAFIGNAQTNAYIQSTVTEGNTGIPIENAEIQIESLDITLHTDAKGFFTFKEVLPVGDYLISVTKESYKTIVFLIKQRENLKINLKEIRLNINKREEKRRKKSERVKRKKQRILDRKKRRLLNQNSIVIEYDTIQKAVIKEVKVVEPLYSDVQYKYAKILEVDVSKLGNKKLYEFIDRWMGTPYLWGGETREAIDCSSFSQRLFIKSYNMYIERTAQKQSDSKNTELFTDLSHLNEGDLLFFGKDQFHIVHVGVYLQNNQFVHATASKVDGASGVKISHINHPYWTKRLMAAGRRITN